MDIRAYQYVIVGAGLAGVSAIQGIRERDAEGPILLVGAEAHLPYDRPPLSKKLWNGKKKPEDIVLHPADWYLAQGAELALGDRVVNLDPAGRTLTLDGGGRRVRYEKLLLATGGIPRTLTLPGAGLPGIHTFRTLDDYRTIRDLAVPGSSALVIGSGFIGAEIAAALCGKGVRVTMVYPEARLIPRVFPEALGRALQAAYAGKGIEMLPGRRPASFSREGDSILTETDAGQTIRTRFVIAGIGIAPATELAIGAGLKTGNGILVDERLATSDPDIFAAGDNADFLYRGLGGKRMRLEHWDNALSQGLHAGRSMAGASEPFDAMPYFFSDLFEFGFEAVGEVDSKMEVVADWQKENDTGVLYYLNERKVRGVMCCNVWDRMDAARQLIREGRTVAPGDLAGAIR